MENRNDVIKTFREARIAGEKLLSRGKITWDSFAATMAMYELKLQGMGVIL